MAITLFSEDPLHSSHEEQSNSSSEPPRDLSQRVQRLEEEVVELRGVVTRFADIVIGEVKKTQAATTPPEQGEAMPPAVPGLVSQTGAVLQPPSQRRRWLIADCIRDIRTTIQMYLDPQYRVRRSTQLMVPLILAIFVFNIVFFNWIFTVAILSSILEKLVDVLLAIILYKVLHQEMERYREALAQAAAWHTYQASRSDFITMTTDSANPPTTRLETE